MRWQNASGEIKLLASSKASGLVSIENIDTVVKAVFKDICLHLADEISIHGAVTRKLREENEKRESDQYYVSRFFRLQCEKFST